MEQIILNNLPLIIVIIAILYQYKVFVTPTQLADTKQDILEEVENKYATREMIKDIKENIAKIEKAIDDIRNYIMSERH